MNKKHIDDLEKSVKEQQESLDEDKKQVEDLEEQVQKIDELQKALKKFVKQRVPEVMEKRELDLYREKGDMYEKNK